MTFAYKNTLNSHNNLMSKTTYTGCQKYLYHVQKVKNNKKRQHHFLVCVCVCVLSYRDFRKTKVKLGFPSVNGCQAYIHVNRSQNKKG